jgi:hypothetical protein
MTGIGEQCQGMGIQAGNDLDNDEADIEEDPDGEGAPRIRHQAVAMRVAVIVWMCGHARP